MLLLSGHIRAITKALPCFKPIALTGTNGLDTLVIIEIVSGLLKDSFRLTSTNMDADDMDNKYIRIAELSEQIERIGKMIHIHEQASDNQSMSRQYNYKRDELISELQEALRSLPLNVRLEAA